MPGIMATKGVMDLAEFAGDLDKRAAARN